ncbi:Dam family site-specific DNA-(adenine-N6)-methyltransferase [Faecalicoccus pleomorphus]|uniref:Dam family site-specific DNA-(adenine-N6)-methyltransferase n=1 Tax=Faecalicoccus pleomorphus TaxID=1323 RepID=UPI0019603158|nr:Dam family site-specific DNA-(adenine-N6)-methyltransferase [Faecalicoccus pleomorphus]MBM6808387.1 Dam family site-specific DNA-(adenine-N6)-methyltransferase [Faecalicoccus pleomorphus]
MRYLGNKDSIVSEIKKLLIDKNLLNNKYVLFDAFCGTGSVSDYLKDELDLIINDNLTWSVLFSKGRINASLCTFNKLGFNPFVYLNSNTKIYKGFMYKNYSPAETDRMYFTTYNAGRIDYFRKQIEEWKDHELINDNEYSYLIASLIDSVSKVSNTAGVYGAYLKKWDSRATKDIIISEVDHNICKPKKLKCINSKIEDIIENVQCDILYMDPPYTQNQYGTQYHLLETLVLNDNPTVSKVTGSRKTAPMRSDWSKAYKCHILLDRIVAKTKAKHILLSYNNTGLMSKEFIEAVLKRYGKLETYICRKIQYKKYQNWKSSNMNTNYEYLFYIEKKDSSEVYYESPLNYTGNKTKIISNIRSYLPKNIDTFYDLFGGGFNVGVNVNAKLSVYNDINYIVSNLIYSFKQYDTYEYILFVKRIIKKYGLEKGAKEPYLNLRDYYNSLEKVKKDPRILYTLIMYGYQQQIRFNSNHEFNNPIGMRWFNDKILEKMISFSRILKERKYLFYHKDYKVFINKMNSNCFVYVDPPYSLTTGAYNDGKRGFNGWNKELENELFCFLDEINNKKIPFMLSYVIEHRGKVNDELLRWVNKKDYTLIKLGDVLGISGSRRKEVLIINYDL